jgi:hypothetical protein
LQALLLASGEYRVPWLKRERVMWHPDKAANKWCAEKTVLEKKMARMFDLYGQLITDINEAEQ